MSRRQAMLEFARTQSNVALVRVSGEVTGEDVERIVADVESLLAEYQEIGVVADMSAMDGMTGEAVLKDIASQFKFLGDWKRFPKVAVIAEPGWLEGLAKAMGSILPQIEVRTFAPGEEDAALAFASTVKPDRIEG